MGEITTCPLCKHGRITRDHSRHDINVAQCDCGEWEFTDQDVVLHRVGDRKDRWLLSAWLRNRHERTKLRYRYDDRGGGQLPTDLREPPVLQKIDNALLWIADESQGFGSPVDVDKPGLIPLLWARGETERGRLFLHLSNVGLADAGTATKDRFTIPKKLSLTAEGWARVDQLRPTGARGRTAFAAMWFSVELNPIFDQGIAPALDACGYDAYRVDRDHFEGKIDDHVLAQIRRAALVIADCTGERPNAYFEAGFAMGLGVPVIWTCREGGRLHFDVQQYPCIFWKGPEDLRQQLQARIEALYPLDPLARRP